MLLLSPIRSCYCSSCSHMLLVSILPNMPPSSMLYYLLRVTSSSVAGMFLLYTSFSFSFTSKIKNSHRPTHLISSLHFFFIFLIACSSIFACFWVLFCVLWLSEFLLLCGSGSEVEEEEEEIEVEVGLLFKKEGSVPFPLF